MSGELEFSSNLQKNTSLPSRSHVTCSLIATNWATTPRKRKCAFDALLRPDDDFQFEGISSPIRCPYCFVLLFAKLGDLNPGILCLWLTLLVARVQLKHNCCRA